MDGPVILCGFGKLGQRVLDCLQAANVPVVVIDNQSKSDTPKPPGVQFITGDIRDRTILSSAEVAKSRGVLIVTSNDLVNLSSALMVRQLAPTVRIVIRLFNQNLLTQLGKALPNCATLTMSGLAAPLLALTATTGEVLGTFQVGEEQFQVAEITVTEKSPLDGKTIADVDRLGQFLQIALTKPGRPSSLLRDIPLDACISAGDKVTLAGRPQDLKKLQATPEEEGDVRWAGQLRRFGRMAYRTFAELDLAVKICTITLLVVVFTSSAVYHWGLGKSWAQGLYQTISVISTGNDLGAEREESWGKIYVSFLRIFGTVLVAAFTAILTNFLIRAKLGGVLEVRRIPDSGHVVVIGLGNVGFRVVEELLRLGEKPVVIEMKKDDTFVNRCRRLGVPVIVGDGTSREVLKQSRVREARAVICVTEDDLCNLEIALLVGDLKPAQRVVVRLAESALAETVRSVAGVKMALSLPELAAPAFVAGLLGDRVFSLFQTGGRTLAIVELNVMESDEHAFLGKSLKALAIDYGFLPVCVRDQSGTVREYRNSLQQIEVGDRLLVIIPLDHLDLITRKVQPKRVCSVLVESYPISARLMLHSKIRSRENASDDKVELILDHPPFLFEEDLSEGEAEVLVDSLEKEKIASRIQMRRDRDP